MKITILTMPRCFSKSLQQLIADTLPEDQVKLNYPKAARLKVNHCDELLHFSNRSVMGLDSDGRFVAVKHADTAAALGVQDLQFFEPKATANGDFDLRRTLRKTSNDLEPREVSNTIAMLADTKKSWVVKVFPTLYGGVNGWRYKDYLGICRELMDASDVVVPLLRLNNRQRVNSLYTSLHHGVTPEDWDGFSEIMQPTKDFMDNSVKGEFYFRQLCHDLGLLDIVWAEALPKDHAKILARFGIDTSGFEFPDKVEYSRFRRTINVD